MGKAWGDPAGPVVLFDGTCALCTAAARFVSAHDRAGTFRFATLQSEAGPAPEHGRGPAPVPGDPGSLVLVQGTERYVRSEAVLRIARQLDGAWPLLYGLVVVPRFLRDAVYRAIARRRHRWFG